MASEDPFRWILIAGSALVFPVLVFHRLRSQATGERLNRREEGIFLMVALRLFGVAGLLGFVTYMASPQSMAWASLPLPPWSRWLGVGLGALAGALLVWTLSHLGKNLTDTVVTRKEHTLVTSGPYARVRHPFYVAFALALLGNALAAANWFIAACGLVAFCLIAIRLGKEEQNLALRFGDAYRRYRERTGRFLPRLR